MNREAFKLLTHTIMVEIYSFIDVTSNRSHNIPHEDTLCPSVPKITLGHLSAAVLPLVPLTPSPCHPPGIISRLHSLAPASRALPAARSHRVQAPSGGRSLLLPLSSLLSGRT